MSATATYIRHDWRSDATTIGVLALALCGLVMLGIGIGSSFMPPDRVLAALAHQGSRTDQVIVWTLRLPRVALAVLGGACLALSGAILQRVTRNPLAAPSILGITDGAALGVVTFLWLFSDEANNLTVSIHWQPFFAVVGALLFAAVVTMLTLADRRGGPLRLLLYGVALAALAKAAVTLIMILGPIYRASQAMIWLTGSVGAAHWSDVRLVAVLLLISVPILWAAARPLVQMQLDSDSARSTGLALGWSQVMLLALAVVLTAGSVAFMGAVGFVGLLAPHAADRLVRHRGGLHLVATGLIGSALVLGADIVARVAMPPLELPAGALTALFGAPFFLILLLRRRQVHG